MKYAVTGSTGLVGNNLVRYLLEQGHQVRVVVRPSSDLKALHGLDVEILTGSWADPSFVSQCTKSIDGLFHVAAMIWIGRSKLEESRRINVEMTRVFAQACRNQNLRFLHVSSVDALAAGSRDQPATESDLSPAKPPSAYVTTKREAEQVVLEEVAQGLDAVITNPGFMCGPYDWKPSSGQMILAMTQQWVPATPGGGLSVADVRDVVCGITAAMERGRSGERYILGGTNMTYLSLFRKMAACANKHGPWIRMPHWLAATVGRVGDTISWFRQGELQVNSPALALGQLYHYYDSSKAIQELGYEFGPIDIAIADAWQWLNQNGYVSNQRNS